jgi:hypothetical protein
MHIAFPVVFAAMLDELLKLVVPFVFLIFWVLSQIAEAKKKAKSPRPAQPPVPSSKPAEIGNAPQAGAANDPLRAQVDAFLRRAGGQAPAAAAGGAAAGAAVQNPRPAAVPNRDSIEILFGNDPASANRPPLSQPPLDMATRSAPSLPTPSTPPVPTPPRPQRTSRSPQRAAAPRSKSVADHVDEYVTSTARQMSEEAARLGDRVTQGDRQFNSQLQQKFDHEIGTFGDRRNERAQEQQPVAAPVNPAVTIATLLANADGMRQAMIINEVLRRPEERW